VTRVFISLHLFLSVPGRLWRVVKRASRPSPRTRVRGTFSRVPHMVRTSFGLYLVNVRAFVAGISSYGGGQFFITVSHGSGASGLSFKADARSGYFSLDRA